MRKRFTAVLLILAIMMMVPAIAMAEETGSTKMDMDKVKSVVIEALNKINVDKLTQENSSIIEKYKFSDEDVAQLKDATKAFGSSIDDFAKALKAAAPDKKVPAPHDSLNNYCSKLQAFLEKYKVTCEDVLTVSKTAALMLVDDPKKAPADAAGGKIPTKDEIQAAFDRLIDFSKQYNIMASDLVPVIDSISDIGLSVLENRVDIEKASKTEGYWRTKITAFGASKDQADNLFKSVMNLKRKYNMKMSEIKKLGDDLSQQLKIGPSSESDKGADTGTDKGTDKSTDTGTDKDK
ncbi:MAG: hypothetical protein AB9903_29900 [Vulcanimicrobiota bacterium]